MLLKLRPDRIGHGTCIYPDRGGDKELVDTMLEAKIPLGIIFPYFGTFVLAFDGNYLSE